MRCVICGQPLTPAAPQVATRDGAVVHIACADRVAAQAWRTRRAWATLHGALIITLALVAWRVGADGRALTLLLVGGAVSHARWHRRWWRIHIQHARRAIRRTMRPH